MESVINKLQEFSSTINLSERFDYKFDISKEIFSELEIETLNNQANPYECNVKLKWILRNRYVKAQNTTDLDFWIINSWGGIKGFKKVNRNIEKIAKFRRQLEKKRLSQDTFSTISSLSKLSSFYNPDYFVIYDSRVIYAINWLMLTSENQQELRHKYFPTPSGRNRIIADFDMNTILNLYHIKEYCAKERVYIPYETAYFEFCKFVREATKRVFGKDSKPYELEMLLFTLADQEIFQEIKDYLRITIGNLQLHI